MLSTIVGLVWVSGFFFMVDAALGERKKMQENFSLDKYS